MDTPTILCSPNEDFGRPNKHFRTHLRTTCQRFVAQIRYSHPWKVVLKRTLKGLNGVPKSSFYAPQTKILERRSNIRERIFKALFTHVSTRFGLRSFEKCFENTFTNVDSAFQNLRLGSIRLGGYICTLWCAESPDRWGLGIHRLHNYMLPKRRCWKSTQTLGNVFSKHFSHTWVLDLGDVHLKSALKMRSWMFIRPSQIFVWWA